MSRRQGNDSLGHVTRFGLHMAEEFPPCWGVEEEIAHIDGGTNIPRHRSEGAADSPFDHQLCSLLCIRGARVDRHSRHGADRGERLAAKTERLDGE